MEKHRKSDQYYIDLYDRMTIEKMRELARLKIEADKQFANSDEKINKEGFLLGVEYMNTGAYYAQNKENFIRNMMLSDERKDRLIESNPIPTNVRCDTCFDLMEFELHMFTVKDDNLTFVFTCPNGHLPKKALYPDGRERVRTIRSCEYCNGELISKSKKTKKKLTITNTCKRCNKIDVTEFEFDIPKLQPINEDERKKYCTDFIGEKSFDEGIKELADLFESIEESQNSKYSYDHIQQLNIAKMEQLLTEQIEKEKFIKLQFDKPQKGRYLTVEFSVQDPTDRDARKSIQILKKTIETTLFTTNWRLMSTEISYDLGFLTGKVKGYSLEEDLIKIGKEIDKKETQKDSN